MIKYRCILALDVKDKIYLSIKLTFMDLYNFENTTGEIEERSQYLPNFMVYPINTTQEISFLRINKTRSEVIEEALTLSDSTYEPPEHL